MPFRHYGGQSGVREAVWMQSKYGLIEHTDDGAIVLGDVVHDVSWWL